MEMSYTWSLRFALVNKYASCLYSSASKRRMYRLLRCTYPAFAEWRKAPHVVCLCIRMCWCCGLYESDGSCLRKLYISASTSELDSLKFWEIWGQFKALDFGGELTSQVKMIIKVHTVSGRKHDMDVEPNMTIGVIKEELQQREGISVVQQRLLFHGQNLHDETTIDVARLADGDVLHMVTALRAG